MTTSFGVMFLSSSIHTYIVLVQVQEPVQEIEILIRNWKCINKKKESKNMTKTLIDRIRNNDPKLTRIDLSYDSIIAAVYDYEGLVTVISNNNKNCEFACADETLLILAEALRNNTFIDDIDLSNNDKNFSTIGWIALTESLLQRNIPLSRYIVSSTGTLGFITIFFRILSIIIKTN
jgi:hypothetical protein